MVYTLVEIGVHEISPEGDAEFYADDKIERYSKEVFLKICELETDFPRDSESCQPTCEKQIQVLQE